jgi:hypothetical protein
VASVLAFGFQARRRRGESLEEGIVYVLKGAFEVELDKS